MDLSEGLVLACRVEIDQNTDMSLLSYRGRQLDIKIPCFQLFSLSHEPISSRARSRAGSRAAGSRRSTSIVQIRVSFKYTAEFQAENKRWRSTFFCMRAHFFRAEFLKVLHREI
eukprot:COSAG05_NODE_995_length_6259_cov_2.194805_4_plen_114_part_00